ERIDTFHTRPRGLVIRCDFHDVDKEILAQITQCCTSSRVRRKALKDNLNIMQLLGETRSLELSESRAAIFENAAAANAVSSDVNAYSVNEP
ncbi:MAG: hypothetical protein M3H12_00385, partial [Chromatiales bacterium]